MSLGLYEPALTILCLTELCHTRVNDNLRRAIHVSGHFRARQGGNWGRGEAFLRHFAF